MGALSAIDIALWDIMGKHFGLELAEGTAQKHPYKPRRVHTRLNVDGSVVDQ